MSSLPLNQQAPPATQQSYGYQMSHHGSVGPVVAVMVVIMILGAMAVVVGRLCSGKRLMGYGQYDLESWAESKCSSCIDGRVTVPLPRVNGSAAPPAVSAPPLQTLNQTPT